jgi:predicted O-methyltransferase YrrM
LCAEREDLRGYGRRVAGPNAPSSGRRCIQSGLSSAFTPGPPTSIRGRIRTAKAGLLSLFGIEKGFFTPYDYAPFLQEVDEPYAEVEQIFERSPFSAFLSEMASHISEFRKFQGGSSRPDWQQLMFPQLDGAAAYTAVKKFKPRRILEIGSGDSTFYLAEASKGRNTEITCIDPNPRRAVEALPVQFLRRMLNNKDAERCALLEENDILFIDSSHIMLPGMDVDIQINRCFPKLKPGVLVHLHDIFLPDNYPSHWRERRYSEQNALIGWIIAGYFDVVYPSHYVLTRHWSLIEQEFRHYPITQTRSAGSLWLKKR